MSGHCHEPPRIRGPGTSACLPRNRPATILTPILVASSSIPQQLALELPRICSGVYGSHTSLQALAVMWSQIGEHDRKGPGYVIVDKQGTLRRSQVCFEASGSLKPRYICPRSGNGSPSYSPRVVPDDLLFQVSIEYKVHKTSNEPGSVR